MEAMVAAILQAVTSSIGMAIQVGQYNEAINLRKQVADAFGDSILPRLDKAVENLVGESAYSRIVEDPSLRRSQMDVLRELEEVYRTEGMTPADRAALQMNESSVANAGLASGANLSQDLARRGTGGAGIQAMANAAGGQAATTGLAQLNRTALKDARERALRALESSGRMAGDIRGADYKVSSDKASAQDRINLFDAEQRQQTQAYNLGLSQAEFNNRMRQLGARANAINGVALATEAEAGRTGDRFNAMGQQMMDAGLLLAEMNKQDSSKKDDNWGTDSDWGDY